MKKGLSVVPFGIAKADFEVHWSVAHVPLTSRATSGRGCFVEVIG